MPEETFSPTNVRENWVLYDAILIGGNIPTLYPTAQWYDTYTALAAQNEISFFNMRNRSMVGEQYCNQDSIDKMTFPMLIDSLGVQFFGFSVTGKYDSTPAPGCASHWQTNQQMEDHANYLWLSELAKHCAVILKINQDEKVVLNCQMAPSGYGVAGTAVPHVGGGNFIGSLNNWGNGEKEISNRFKFPVPLEAPRGVTISCRLEFSTVARMMLASMIGPNILVVNDHEYEHVEHEIAAASGIRISLMGHRFVQQRGQLHY